LTIYYCCKTKQNKTALTQQQSGTLGQGNRQAKRERERERERDEAGGRSGWGEEGG